jgi:hypothetical protein
MFITLIFGVDFREVTRMPILIVLYVIFGGWSCGVVTEDMGKYYSSKFQTTDNAKGIH